MIREIRLDVLAGSRQATEMLVFWNFEADYIYKYTSTGARAMRGFGAMCLLRSSSSRCMFLAVTKKTHEATGFSTGPH
jgi:hypothetical protein